MYQNEISQLFERFADQPALTSLENGTTNYRELGESVRSTLRFLLENGVTPSDTVCLVSKNHPMWFQLFLSALYSGIQFAPANWRLPESELSPLLAELAPVLVISDEEFDDVSKRALPNSRHLSIKGFLSQSQLKDSSSWPSIASPHHDDCVLLLKTGGTTGRSKWARQRYEQIWLNAYYTAEVCELDHSSCVVQATPLFHAGANALATPLLLNGGHVVLMRDFEPTDYLSLTQKHRAKLVFGVPTVYQMLLQSPDFSASALPDVEWLLSGGAPCPRDLASQLADRGFTVKQGFGMTEAGVNCFQLSTVATAGYVSPATNAVGLPMPHAQMQIRDGELIISGKAIFGGYLSDDRSEQTPPTEVKTGDLFYVDDDGCYFVRGRRKEMYISGGENVFPLEVENHLADLPLLNSVAVVGVDSDQWGETGLAACVLESDETPDSLLRKISVFLEGRLATYKHPNHVMIFESLPLTPAGKVDKKAIKQLWK
jgi:fatty-acyl-CoA synthase